MTGLSNLLKPFYQSLLPYPGPGNQVLRTMVSCILVILISLGLQIPWLAISLVVVFFVTQTNVILTKATGFLFFAAVTASIGSILIVLIATWNTPFLRLLVSMLILLSGVFLMRTSKMGVIFFLVAVIVSYGQTLVDISPDPEIVVRELLWLWVSMVYSIAVTLIVNTLLLPVEPRKQLQDAILRQLSVVAEFLVSPAEKKQADRDAVSVGINLQTLYKYLRFSVMRDDSGTFNESRSMDIVTFTSELRALSGRLPESFDNLQDAQAAQQLSREIMTFCRLFAAGDSHEQQPVCLVTDNPILQEMAQLVTALIRSAATVPALSEEAGRANSGPASFLAADAFTNSNYIIFSLKTLLTVVLCYLFYIATDWPGIHTIMISCVIVAQPGLGNIRRKMFLRLGGAAIGSLFALLAIVLVIPQIDSVFGLLLLVMPVLLLAAWVTTGPENISYAGIQIAVTFALAVLESNGPVYDLTEVRDRLIGIFAGIVVAGMVHALISPEREGAVLAEKLAGLLDTARKKWLTPSHELRHHRADVLMNIADCGELISRVALEPAWTGTEGAHDAFYQRAQEIFMAVKNLIFSADKVSLAYQEYSRQCSDSARQDMSRIMVILGRNLDIITACLRGKLTEDVSYPELPQTLNAGFSAAVAELSRGVELFFRITGRQRNM